MGSMSEPLGSYAQWQLSRSSTPRSVLADLTRRAVGREMIRADRILEGYSNEVYRVRCADGQDAVVRILRYDDDLSSTASEAEARAIERARQAGVPAPEILLLDTITIAGDSFPIMVQRTVPGRPLSDVIRQLSGRQQWDVLVEIGELISRLNQIPADHDHDRVTPVGTQPANRGAERDKINTDGLSSSEYDLASGLVARYRQELPCQQRVLCHGDLSLKHIYVASGPTHTGIRVSGVIDFGDWTAAASVHDLAVFRAREPQFDPTPMLVGHGSDADVSYRRRLDLHTLMIALDSLAFAVREGDEIMAVASGTQVRSLIGDLTGC